MDFDAGPWPALVRALAAEAREPLVSDARRIAGGELTFWGRNVRVNPRGLPWHEGVFAPELAAGLAWAADPKCRLELQRQQHLFALAAGGYLATEPAWARLALDQVLDWIARMPPTDDGRGAGYEAAHRLVSWAWALPFATATGSEVERCAIASAFRRTAAVARQHPSSHSSANNHRLAELAGLLGFEAVAVERSQWGETWQEFERELLGQTFPDGGSREQASGYFLYVLEIAWVAALFARAVGQELGRARDRLEAMLDWLQATGGEDGEPAPVGDDAEDRFVRVDYFRPRRASVVAGRLRALLRDDPALLPAHRSAREPASRFLRDSGYVVMRGRVGAAGVRLVLDVGTLGFGTLAAHGHADALALIADIGGESLLRDSGTGSYLPGAGRDEYRVTAAHNTVCVDGESQAQPLGPHLWGRRFRTTVDVVELGGAIEYVRAAHDGYRARRARAVHTRSVTYVRPGLVVVLDRVTAERPCDVDLVWQAMPGRSLEALGWGSLLVVAAQPQAVRSDDLGPYSARYTSKGDGPRTRFSANGSDVAFASVLVLSADAPITVEVRHAPSETVVELSATPRLRLVERWAGGPAEVAVA